MDCDPFAISALGPARSKWACLWALGRTRGPAFGGRERGPRQPIHSRRAASKHENFAAPARSALGRMANRGGWRFCVQASKVQILSAALPAPEFAPGLRARDKPAPPAVQLASSAARSGGAISFTVHQRQLRMGEGWLISDSPGLPPVARLLLPGERAPYGDQSRVTENERWQLQGNHAYWLEIRRFRAASGGALPVYRARTPPFRFSKSKPETPP